MSSNDGEAENLRKQIQYLESLIITAKAKKAQDNSGNGRASSVGSNKPPVDSIPHVEHYRPYSSSEHIARKDSTKYSWNRLNAAKELDHLPSHGNTSRTKDHSSLPSFKRSTGSSFVNRQKGNHQKPLFTNVQNDSQIRANVSEFRHTSQIRANAPEFQHNSEIGANVQGFQGTPCLSNKDKIYQNKSKSLFTWNRYSENKNSAESLQAKRNQALERTSASQTGNTTEFPKGEPNQVDIRLKHSTTAKWTKTGKSVEKLKSDKKPKSPKPFESEPKIACIGNSKTDTSASPKKHSALHVHLMEAQTKLEVWKRTLLEKKKKAQASIISVKDRNVTHPSHSKRFMRSRQHANKPAPYFSKYHHQYYSQPYTHPTRLWKIESSYLGWKSKHHYRKMHDSFSRGGRCSQRGRGWKYRSGFQASYMYNVPDYAYSGRRILKNEYSYSKRPIHLGHRFQKQQRISKVYVRKRVQRIKRLKDQVPFDPKMKLDRRKQEGNRKGLKFVVINGMLYKTTQKSLVRASGKQPVPSPSKSGPSAEVTGTGSRIKFLSTTAMKTVIVRGVKFKVDRDGKHLKRLDMQQHDGTSMSQQVNGMGSVSRVDIGGVTYRQTKPGTLERVTTRKTRVMATRVLNKSMAQVASKHKKDNRRSSKQQQFCMFYNRFGKCNRQEKCPFIHDPDRIAVCTQFLRGTCKVKQCPFSHKVSAEKMPVCSYFLKGVCNKSDCPYLHVNVNRDAEICQDFVNGYCALGKKCKKKHTLLCPAFVKTGACPEGKKCKLQHRKPRTRKLSSKSQTTKHTRDEHKALVSQSDQKPAVLEDCDIDIPFKERRLPAYISLNIKGRDNSVQSYSQQGTSDISTEESRSMKIRPQL